MRLVSDLAIPARKPLNIKPLVTLVEDTAIKG
jgi:hypothetical protein